MKPMLYAYEKSVQPVDSSRITEDEERMNERASMTGDEERVFAQALLLYRQAMGLTQDQFAESLSVSSHTVKSWERNTRITKRTLPRVLEDIGKSREELLGWYEDTIAFVETQDP